MFVHCATCEDRVLRDRHTYLAIAPGRTDLAARFNDKSPLTSPPAGRKSKQKRKPRAAPPTRLAPFLCLTCGLRHATETVGAPTPLARTRRLGA